jgi:hypothetical protein
MATLFSSLVGSQAAMINYNVKSALSESKEHGPRQNPFKHRLEKSL